MGSRRLTFRVPEARQDELVAELWALGTDGVHVRSAAGGPVLGGGGEELLDAYFDEGLQVGGSAVAYLGALCEAELVEELEVEPRDWLEAYREMSAPIPAGPFLIDPGEPERSLAAPAAGPASGETDRVRYKLRIPARNAFGTGSHESTRLLLEEFGELELDGRSVLDVGTGSGILAFAALLRGARSVVAFDPDVGSVVTARDNARLNDLAPRLFAGKVDAVAGRFDVVLVNILPHRWLAEAARVVDCLAPGGLLLVSGLLAEEEAKLLATSALSELQMVGRRSLGEWAALRLAQA